VTTTEVAVTQEVPHTSPPSGTTRGAGHGQPHDLEGFLVLLARAIRQVHAYPHTSAVCIEAVAACRSHLARLEGRADVSVEVSPDGTLSADQPIGENATIQHEMVRRLRRARVINVTIELDASERDLTRFCTGLVRCGERGYRGPSLTELLLNDGVTAIGVSVAARPEVLAIGSPAPAQRELLVHDRRRRAEAAPLDAHKHHLFPAHKGWIRIDPATDLESLGLADLAILVDDPRDLATMLHRLVDDGPVGEATDETALERRFSDLATLFSSLDPRLARVMFGKLARAVLAMDPARRKALIKRAVLPAVFEGRAEASILDAFPEPDLAEALTLLLDLETAAPALVTAALDQLGLDPARRAVVDPLIRQHTIAARGSDAGLDSGAEQELDRQARLLTRVDAAAGRSFAEFAAFDLAMDDRARASIATVRDAITTSDSISVELSCLINLIRIQPNPEVADPFARGAMARCQQLLAAGRWSELVDALVRLRAIADLLAESRAEIAALVNDALSRFASADCAAALVDVQATGEAERGLAAQAVNALGDALVPSCIALLSGPRSSAAVALLSDHAARLGPGLAAALADCPDDARHLVVRLLGQAGPGYESIIGDQLGDGDERMIRECLRALARLGTAEAVALVAAQVRARSEWLPTAALEVLLRFPAELIAPHVRELLRDRDVALRQPEATARLLDRAARMDRSGLDDALKAIFALRFRFWNRPLVRAARAAGALVRGT
jgi:hypothetical protein